MSGEREPTAPVDGIWDRGTPLGRAFGAIDDAGNRWADVLRGRRWADAGAAVLSNLSDHGAVWVLAAAWKARRPGAGRRRAVVALAVAGVASYCVNRAAKRAVGRTRPEHVEPSQNGLPVREPASSSFPSGHTLASFCTAVVLPGDPSTRRIALVFATTVAASRVHLRAHHSSDVVGGAAIGAVLGTLVRPIVDLLAPRAGSERWRQE